MAGEFTSWAAILAKAKDALASGEIERFMRTTVENSREMKSVMSNSKDLKLFIGWLEEKAATEALGTFEGQLFFTPVGGEG